MGVGADPNVDVGKGARGGGRLSSPRQSFPLAFCVLGREAGKEELKYSKGQASVAGRVN